MPDLNIGTVLLTLNLLGKVLVVMLRLNIWARGWLISTAIAFSNLVLIPSISVLVFEMNDFIVVTMTAGDIAPSSSCGGLGLGGMNASGSRQVGLTVLEILQPTVVKKLLNSLAIMCLSVMLLPFAVMVSILKVLLLGLMASFRRSQVFFGVFGVMFEVRFKVKLFAVAEYRVVHITISSVGCNVCTIWVVNREFM